MTVQALGTANAAAPGPLWAAIRQAGMPVVSVLGMAKNTGKTVTLNHLLEQAARRHVSVGLSSIGRDGEGTDAVFSNPKPPVTVWPGAVVATAAGTRARSRVRTRLLGATGIHGPLGEVLLLQALEPGEMEVAGPSHGRDQLTIVDRLRQCGVDQILLDGALGRSQHASPALADGVVLATGAAVGGGLGDVLRKTLDRLAVLEIGVAGEGLLGSTQSLFAGRGVGLLGPSDEWLWRAPMASLNAAEALLAHATPAVRTVAVTGAVGTRLWAALMALAARAPGLRLLVEDGTRLFVGTRELAAFAQRGGCVLARRPIRVAGVTVSPFSPLGGHLDARELLHEARTALAPRLVVDVMQPAPACDSRCLSRPVPIGQPLSGADDVLSHTLRSPVHG